MADNGTPGTIVRGYALKERQDAIVREYARRRCAGNTSLAIRTIIMHFDSCPDAADTEPVLDLPIEESVR